MMNLDPGDRRWDLVPRIARLWMTDPVKACIQALRINQACLELMKESTLQWWELSHRTIGRSIEICTRIGTLIEEEKRCRH